MVPYYRSLAGDPQPGANIIEAVRRIYAQAFPGQSPGDRSAVAWLKWLVNNSGAQIKTAGEVFRKNLSPIGILIDIFHGTAAGRDLLTSLDKPGVLVWGDTPYRPLPIDMAGQYAVDPVHYYDTTVKVLSWVRLPYRRARAWEHFGRQLAAGIGGHRIHGRYGEHHSHRRGPRCGDV
jgi:hypothetical protein